MTQRKSKLAKWLGKNDVTLTQLSEDTGLAYRTCSRAAHGFRVTYETAVILSRYTKGEIEVSSLCSARPGPYKGIPRD